MKFKYIGVFTFLIGFLSCEQSTGPIPDEVILPELSTGQVDFSNYVALGASFTAGFTDGALFIAGQENSFPNILAEQFEKVGGSALVQPLTVDNVGGLAAGGTRIPGFNPRLVFGGAGPVPLEAVVGPVTVGTDIVLNNPVGPFSNMGVAGAKSFHLLFDGYGNPANIATATANPYFVRMASSPSATMLGDAMSQNPTFFTLSEIGGNDVLGFATSGGDGSDNITPLDGPAGVGFNATLEVLISTLTSNGAKGVVTNVPNISDLPHFTTVPHNPVPLDAETAAFLNSPNAYGAYNAGLDATLAFLLQNPGQLGFFFPPANGTTSEEVAKAEIAKRKITFAAGQGNAVVILDENLTDLTAINPALVGMRQATENDLVVLPAASFIGSEAVPGNPQSINGVAIPLADKWILTPEEQEEISIATEAYNNTILSVVASNENVVLVDLNSVLNQLASTGINFDGFNLTADLVTGGAISLDGIHLNPRGYALMANKFLEALDNGFGTNFIASGNVARANDYPTNFSPTFR